MDREESVSERGPEEVFDTLGMVLKWVLKEEGLEFLDKGMDFLGFGIDIGF